MMHHDAIRTPALGVLSCAPQLRVWPPASGGPVTSRLLIDPVAHGGCLGPSDLITSAYRDPEAIGYNMGRVIVYENSFQTTAVPELPNPGFAFLGASPNPARKDVHFDLTLDGRAPVHVSVYDVEGREVARPVAGKWLAGRVTLTWQPQDLPNGIFYVSAKVGHREQVRKLIWLGR